jgi:hypothetical protein
LKVFTVASSSIRAATTSPFSAGLLLPDYYPVAIADCCIDHGLTNYLQQEQLTLADQLPGESKDVLDILVRRDWNAGCNSSHEWNKGGVRTDDLCRWFLT